jgi:hypothetical protein
MDVSPWFKAKFERKEKLDYNKTCQKYENPPVFIPFLIGINPVFTVNSFASFIDFILEFILIFL